MPINLIFIEMLYKISILFALLQFWAEKQHFCDIALVACVI